MRGFEKLGIGPDKPPKLILDFCWNHEGSIGRVRQMLQALRDNLTPEQYSLIIPKFQAGRDLPWDRAMYRGVKKMCEGEFGLPFLCTAFDYKAVDMLDSLDVAAIKIGSAEAMDHDFLQYANATGRSVFISTGGLSRDEFAEIRRLCPIDYLYMYCVSQYPARAEDLALGVLGEAEDYGFTPSPFLGYSSHYPEVNDAIFAFARGAQVVEKHYSDRNWRGTDLPGAGTDFAVSIGPHQAATICQAALDWHKMKGGWKTENVLEAERTLLKPFRERFYANNHQADQAPRQDALASDPAGQDGGEQLQSSNPGVRETP